MTSCPPYRPFRGAEPPHFVERADDDGLGDAVITRCALSAYRRGPADPRFHRLVVSRPGLGKTALLRAVARLATSELGWAVAFHRCHQKERALGRLAGEVLDAGRRHWAVPGAGSRRPVLAGEPSALPVAGGRAPWAPGAAGAWEREPVLVTPGPVPSFVPPGAELPWSALRGSVRLVGQLARQHGSGLLVGLDDVDLLSAGEAECLGHMARSVSRDGLPVAFLMSSGEELGARFARRGNFWGTLWTARLALFDDEEAREALVVPAAERGVDFEEGALEMACAAAQGSPLEVQRLGFAAWSSACQSHVVAATDVEAALGSLAPDLAPTA